MNPPAAIELRAFHAGSAVHWICALALATAIAGTCAAGRRAWRSGDHPGAVFDRRFSIVLLLIWVICQGQNLLPGHLHWNRSLPLHVCDLAGLAAVIAIATRRPIARAMLYFWGLGLSTQAFITPVLYLGPATFNFWTYWLCHLAIVVPAVYDLVVRGYRPGWADWRRMVLVGAAYSAVVIPVDVRLGVNYGYLGPTDFGQTTLMQVLGPWPDRLPILYLMIWAASAAMTWPWTRARDHEQRIDDPHRLTPPGLPSVKKAA
jgi:hypothetical integral membrane protein (TIGR02206 family)